MLALALALQIVARDAPADGPVGKFNNNKPDLEVVTARSIGDVERCLINTTDPFGAPLVYRQPDRPGYVTMIWGATGGNAQRRIDLREVSGGVEVTGWHINKRAPACAPAR